MPCLLLLCRIGMVLSDQGKYPEALESYSKSFEIMVKAFGPDHLETAHLQMCIAMVYKRQGKYGDALQRYRKVLRIEEKVFGHSHPRVAQTKVRLGVSLSRTCTV